MCHFPNAPLRESNIETPSNLHFNPLRSSLPSLLRKRTSLSDPLPIHKKQRSNSTKPRRHTRQQKQRIVRSQTLKHLRPDQREYS